MAGMYQGDGLTMSRFDYVQYDNYAIDDQKEAKELCSRLEVFIDQLESGRPKSLALTKLEEVYMWIGKAIRDDQILRNGKEPLQEERTNS